MGKEQALTDGHKLLIEYLAKIGMPLSGTMYMVMLVWEPEATVKMLKYLLETHDTNFDRLIEIASEISLEYPLRGDGLTEDGRMRTDYSVHNLKKRGKEYMAEMK